MLLCFEEVCDSAGRQQLDDCHFWIVTAEFGVMLYLLLINTHLLTFILFSHSLSFVCCDYLSCYDCSHYLQVCEENIYS